MKGAIGVMGLCVRRGMERDGVVAAAGVRKCVPCLPALAM